MKNEKKKKTGMGWCKCYSEALSERVQNDHYFIIVRSISCKN